QKVAVRIFEIETAPAVVMIDFTLLTLCRISPVGEGPFSHPTKYFVKLCLAYEKSIMLWGNFTVGIHEIDVSAVVCRNDVEWTPLLRRRQAQDFCQKRRRCFAVTGVHDGMVETNGHAYLAGSGATPTVLA